MMDKCCQLIPSVLFAAILCCSCNNSNYIYQNRIKVLNSLYDHYNSFEDSVAVFYESYTYNVNKNNFSDFKNNSFFKSKSDSIPNNDIRDWKEQGKRIKKVNWQNWGWRTPSFVTEKEYPKHFKNEGPPSSEIEVDSLLSTIYYFSIPLIGRNYSFVEVGSKSNKYSWNVTVVIFKKNKSGEWEIYAKKSIFTS